MVFMIQSVKWNKYQAWVSTLIVSKRVEVGAQNMATALVTNVAGWSTTLVESEISPQLLDVVYKPSWASQDFYY